MPSSPPNPHDALFRRVLADPANAVGELRAALPAPIADRIDWTRLELQPGSYVTPDLQSRYTDVLYRTYLAEPAGTSRTAYLYLLIEHQSSSDRLMAVRMLEYTIRIWYQHLRHHPGSRRLPVVIPLVVYSTHAEHRWTAPTELGDLIDLDELDEPTRDALAPYLPRFRYLLDDLTTLDLAALRARDLTPVTRVMLILYKIAPGNAELHTRLPELFDDLRATSDNDGDLEAIIHYILVVSETAYGDLETVFERLGPRGKEAYMTTAEQLEALGRAEGEARGRAEGEVHGRADTVIELLTVKFGPLPATVIATIRTADQARLRDWTSRVLTADTLDDIIR